jgi:hypothetical protein
MSEQQGEVRVRNVRTQRSGSAVESVVEFSGGLVRLGFSLITLATSILPRESRQHMRNGFVEAMYAIASLPRDLVEIGGSTVEDWAREVGVEVPMKAPKDEIATAK